MNSEPETKLSPVEATKAESNYLRGTIASELSGEADSFNKDNVNLLKFHGTYQQDNRDQRASRDGGKSKKAYMFMVRTRIPGGKLTSAQMLAELDLCDEIGNTTLRATTRQGLQLHGVVKQDLKRTIRRINDVQLSTLAACGDVERNVMCCPAPYNADPVHAQMQAMADRLAEHLAPRTRAYHELWLRDLDSPGEDRLVGGGSNGHEVEPLYGATYLPRKFKTAIGLPGDNCSDLYTNDLGFLAICRDFDVVGYNVLVGGGMGVTPSAAKTFPALAKTMAFVTPDQVLDAAAAIIKVQRDFGNRADRKVARLKYLIHDRGLDWFKAKVNAYFGETLAPPMADDVWGFDDHIGWADQGDGRWFYGLNIENGRILDRDGFRLKSALRAVCRELAPPMRITSHQSLLFCDLAPADKSRLEDILRAHDVPLSESISTVRRWSMACVAFPTCGLSITESERALPGLIDQLETVLARLGLSREVFTVRMTGCPNGCARPYNSDVGLVGKTAGKYTVFVGGRLLGNRLNFVYKDLVPLDEIVSTLTPLLVFFKQARESSETFGDFCDRQGLEALTRFAGSYRESETASAAPA